MTEILSLSSLRVRKNVTIVIAKRGTDNKKEAKQIKSDNFTEKSNSYMAMLEKYFDIESKIISYFGDTNNICIYCNLLNPIAQLPFRLVELFQGLRIVGVLHLPSSISALYRINETGIYITVSLQYTP